VLAYVFWHHPADPVDSAGYEARLAAFHDRLRAVAPAGFRESAAFRVGALAWQPGGGYEDWYLVDDWTALGALNAAAVDAQHRPDHDAVASLAGDGAGGVYKLLSGGLPLADAGTARWLAEPPAATPDDADVALWQRQMVLGPAPEFCVLERGADAAFHRLWPRQG
jgi:hypothetical protein